MDETEIKLLREFILQRLSDPAAQAQFARVGRFVLGMLAPAMAVAEEFRRLAIRHREKVAAALVTFNAAMEKVEAAPPSPGYEPLLISRGVDRLVARIFASLFVRLGTREAMRSNNEDQIIPATLRYLSQPGRRVTTIAASAARLRDLPEIEHSLLAVFDGVGLKNDGHRFLGLLDRAATVEPAACRELAGIAQSVADQVKTRRGPRISVPSASHELALVYIQDSNHPVAYTFSDYKGGYTDPVTLATMREFKIANFDPRPAVRRLRKKPR